MVKLIHAADLHLDSPFAGLLPEEARQRRRECRRVLDKLAELVKRERADLVLLAGDLFDGERVYPETLEAMDRAFADMDCPVFIAPGNHDPFTDHGPYGSRVWPDNVYIFRGPKLTAVDLPGRSCVVWGGAFTAPEQREMLLDGFSVREDPRVQLLCLHADVDVPGSAYGPVKREQIAASGLDYLALGHIHACSGLQREGRSFWAYPGCTEGRGFDETGEKGAFVVEVEKGSVSARFVPLGTRQCRVLRLDVTDTDPVRALEKALEPTADLCRVVLTGEVGEQGVDVDSLTERFSTRCFALQIKDETTVAHDIWERAGEESLRGLFLREMRRRYEDADEEAERERIVLAVRFGLAAMDGRDME